MRHMFAFVMVSADGRFEGPDGDLGWHNADAEFEEFAAAQLRRVRTLMLGRRTYEFFADYWPTPEAAAASPETARLMNGTEKAVVSETLQEASWGPARVLKARDVRALKEGEGGDIALLASDRLTASLLHSGLVDELRVMVNPVVLGTGRPLLLGAPRTALTLLDTRVFASGNVLLTYRPEPG